MRKDETATDNSHNHMHYDMLEDAEMWYLHPMFHVFPVVKRREICQFLLVRITDATNITGHVQKNGTHRLRWEEGETIMYT